MIIKFFRKIRQQLLSENKFSKYLLYAIGEIVLVVIGILIALQVSNFNEQKKLRKKELTYLKELSETLSYDLNNELKPCRNDIKKNINAHKEFIKTLNIEIDSLNGDTLWDRMKSWILPWRLQVNFSPFNNLESVGMDLISCDSLRTEISKFYGYEIIYPLNFNQEHHVWLDEKIYDLLNENIYMEGTPWSKSQIYFLKTDLQARNSFNINKVYYMDAKLYHMESLIPIAESLLNHIEKDISKLENE